jgi:hypothetical protein
MKRTLLLLIFGIGFGMMGWGQSFTATYPFSSVTTSSGTTDPTAVPTATGAVFGSFSATGTPANPNAGSRFSFTDWALDPPTVGDLNGTVNTSEYYSVTISPTSGYSITLSSITFTIQRSGTGIRQYSVNSSLDSYASNLPASINPSNATLSVVGTNVFQITDNTSAQVGSTITLGTSFQNISSSVTFRFYGWNAEASGGTFSIDDVVFSGSASSGSSAPTVNTLDPTLIGISTATFNGNITADGGSAITERGFCYKTSAGVTIDDNKTSEGGTTTGTYSKSFTLDPGTQYFYRAFATNAIGATLSTTEISFTTLSTEPSNHPAAFGATANSQSSITTAWSDNDPVPGSGQAASGFLVMANKTGTFTAPTDGTAQTDDTDLSGDGMGVKNVENSIETNESYEWNNGLTAGTEYFFKIFAYNGSGSNINYKTDGDVPAANATTVSTATITVDPTSLTGFNYIQGSGPSTGQTFQLSGSTLVPAAGDLTVTGSTNYEVSVNGTDYYASRTVAYTGGILVATTIYVRLKAGLSAGAYNNEDVVCSGGSAESKNVTCSGNVYKPEPTNHATNPLADVGTPAWSAIDLIWDDATVGTVPDGYLVKGSSTSYEAITLPVDGTPEADGALVKNIAATVGAASFTGLSENTTYYFKIFPFTNSGLSINYKTDGTPAQVLTTTEVRPIPTYTWNAASGNWNTASSWTPERTTPANDDVLIFDGSVQASPVVTLDFTSPQTIGRLRIVNNASVTFGVSNVGRTINVGSTGAATPQLEIAAGSKLTSSAVNAITISLPAGYKGNISGTIEYAGAAHKLYAVDASTITFNSGSKFTAGTGFSSNPFGTANNSSVVFASGSVYEHISGSNPFGATQPGSAVVFQTGSLFLFKANASPSLAGRTYANFEIDNSAFLQAFTGTSVLQMDNLTITNATSVGMNLTGGINIKGNISVAAGTLSFTPATVATLNLNGSGTQTIGGAGTLTFGANCNVTIGATSQVVLNKDLTFGKDVTISSGGSLTINPGKFLTVNGTLTNSGNETNLIVASDASGTGSLICNQSVLATVKRYLTQNYYHYISSPVAEQAISPEFINTDFLTPPSTQPDIDLFKWDETTNTWDNIKQDETNWDLAFGANFTVARGYVYANRTGNVTKNFAGALNVTNPTIPLTVTLDKGKGWNLVGNPFPSAIAANSNTGTANNLMDVNLNLYNVESTALYFWVEQDNYLGSARVSEYKTINNTSSAYYVQPGQAFFVKAKEPVANYAITTAMRKHGTSDFYKSTNADDYNRFSLTVVGPQNDYNETMIGFVPGTTNGIDQGFDAIKRKGNANIALYSKLVNGDAGDFAIQALPQSSANEVVAISLDANKTGTYIFKAGAADNMENFTVKLEDRLTGTFTTLDGNAQYSFNVLTAGKIENRFYLHFKSSVGIEDPATAEKAIYSWGNTIYFETSGNATLNIFNLTGQKIESRQINTGGLQTLNLHAPTGWYIVKLVSADGVKSEKMFIN